MSVSSINRGEYSNTFGIIKICSSQRQFELMYVNQSARPGGIIGYFFDFL